MVNTYCYMVQPSCTMYPHAMCWTKLHVRTLQGGLPSGSKKPYHSLLYVSIWSGRIQKARLPRRHIDLLPYRAPSRLHAWHGRHHILCIISPIRPQVSRLSVLNNTSNLLICVPFQHRWASSSDIFLQNQLRSPLVVTQSKIKCSSVSCTLLFCKRDPSCAFL